MLSGFQHAFSSVGRFRQLLSAAALALHLHSACCSSCLVVCDLGQTDDILGTVGGRVSRRPVFSIAKPSIFRMGRNLTCAPYSQKTGPGRSLYIKKIYILRLPIMVKVSFFFLDYKNPTQLLHHLLKPDT
jgi:hypothetical protein